MNRSPLVSSGKSEPYPATIREAAADWISRRDAGFSPAEEKSFQVWLAADPRHAAAVDTLLPIWAAINRPRHAGHGAHLRRQVAGQVVRQRRRRRAVAIAGLAAAAVIAFALLPRRSAPPHDPAPTIALRPDRQQLPDGSTVELNFGAEIAVDFAPERRGIHLLRGEALFHVAHDESRPFEVVAGHVAVRAVGTAFAVRRDPTQVDVLVTEGRVAVEQKAAPTTTPAPNTTNDGLAPNPASPVVPVFLSAGRRLMFSADSSAPRPSPQLVSSAEVAAALAWRTRRVEFNGTPLAEAVALFNHDNAVQLAVADEATGALRISGVFWTHDPEAFSRVVETSLGIKASQASGGKIVLRQ